MSRVAYPHLGSVWTRRLGSSATVDEDYGSAEEPDLDPRGDAIAPTADFSDLPCRLLELESGGDSARALGRDVRARRAALHFPASAAGKVGRFDRVRVRLKSQSAASASSSSSSEFWVVARVVECRTAHDGSIHHLECEVDRLE